MLALKMSQRSLGRVSLLCWKDVRQEMLESLDERVKKPGERHLCFVVRASPKGVIKTFSRSGVCFWQFKSIDAAYRCSQKRWCSQYQDSVSYMDTKLGA